MLSPSTESAAGIEVRSLNEGGLVRPGESVSFVVHREGTVSADFQLEILLMDTQGNSVWSRTLSDPAANEELELLLPELEVGQYSIVFRVGQAGSSADEQKLTFFYVQGDYAVAGLSSYPPSTFPGAEVKVRAELQVPADADPYVRWTQGGSLLARGMLSEGLEEITWKAPREPGVYPVTVELFPLPPPDGADYSFSSPLAMTARLYISPGTPRSSDALTPEASYYSLFHFDGTLEDRGRVGTGIGTLVPASAELFGGAHFDAGAPAGGVRIGPGSGMRYPRLILPTSRAKAPGEGSQSRPQGPAPWTLTVSLVPEGEPREATLLTSESEDGELGLTLRFDAAGRLSATLRGAGSSVELPSGMPALQPGVLQRIDLSVHMQDDKVAALWFLDGIQTAAITRPLLLREAAGRGATLLGGEDGLEGVVAELGVYFQDEQGRPAVDPSIYRSAMQKRFGGSLVLAEGFEGLYLPSAFLVEGNASLQGGALVLGLGRPSAPEAASSQSEESTREAAAPASRLESPLFEQRFPATAIEIQFRSEFPGGSRIALQWEGEDEGFAELRAERSPTGASFGILVDPGAPESAVTLDPLPANLALRLTADHLAVDPGGGAPGRESPRLPIRRPGEDAGWLKLSLLRPAGAAALELDRILIYAAAQP